MAKSGFSEELIEVAVNYWVKALAADEEEGMGPSDDAALLRLADQSKALSIIALARQRMKPTPEKLALFKEKLRELLIEPINPEASILERQYGVISPRWIELRTDYHAQGLLLLAANHANINDMAFPFKTVMTIKRGKVTVGFPEKVLFEGPAPVGPDGQID